MFDDDFKEKIQTFLVCKTNTSNEQALIEYDIQKAESDRQKFILKINKTSKLEIIPNQIIIDEKNITPHLFSQTIEIEKFFISNFFTREEINKIDLSKIHFERQIIDAFQNDLFILTDYNLAQIFYGHKNAGKNEFCFDSDISYINQQLNIIHKKYANLKDYQLSMSIIKFKNGDAFDCFSEEQNLSFNFSKKEGIFVNFSIGELFLKNIQNHTSSNEFCFLILIKFTKCSKNEEKKTAFLKYLILQDFEKLQKKDNFFDEKLSDQSDDNNDLSSFTNMMTFLQSCEKMEKKEQKIQIKKLSKNNFMKNVLSFFTEKHRTFVYFFINLSKQYENMIGNSIDLLNKVSLIEQPIKTLSQKMIENQLSKQKVDDLEKEGGFLVKINPNTHFIEKIKSEKNILFQKKEKNEKFMEVDNFDSCVGSIKYQEIRSERKKGKSVTSHNLIKNTESGKMNEYKIDSSFEENYLSECQSEINVNSYNYIQNNLKNTNNFNFCKNKTLMDVRSESKFNSSSEKVHNQEFSHINAESFEKSKKSKSQVEESGLEWQLGLKRFNFFKKEEDEEKEEIISDKIQKTISDISSKNKILNENANEYETEEIQTLSVAKSERSPNNSSISDSAKSEKVHAQIRTLQDNLMTKLQNNMNKCEKVNENHIYEKSIQNDIVSNSENGFLNENPENSLLNSQNSKNQNILTFKTENLKTILNNLGESHSKEHLLSKNTETAKKLKNQHFQEMFHKFDSLVKNEPIKMFNNPNLNKIFSFDHIESVVFDQENDNNNNINQNQNQNPFYDTKNTPSNNRITTIQEKNEQTFDAHWSNGLNTAEETNQNITKIVKKGDKNDHSIWSDINYFEEEPKNSDLFIKELLSRFDQFLKILFDKIKENFKINLEIESFLLSSLTQQSMEHLKQFFKQLQTQIIDKFNHLEKILEKEEKNESLIESVKNDFERKKEHNFMFNYGLIFPKKLVSNFSIALDSIFEDTILEKNKFQSNCYSKNTRVEIGVQSDLKKEFIIADIKFDFILKKTINYKFLKENTRENRFLEKEMIDSEEALRMEISNLSVPSNVSCLDNNSELSIAFLNNSLTNHVAESRISALKNIVKHLKEENNSLKSAKMMLENHFLSTKLKRTTELEEKNL